MFLWVGTMYFNAVPSHGVVATNPAATIDDYKPGVNLATFGSCQTTSIQQ